LGNVAEPVTGNLLEKIPLAGHVPAQNSLFITLQQHNYILDPQNFQVYSVNNSRRATVGKKKKKDNFCGKDKKITTSNSPLPYETSFAIIILVFYRDFPPFGEQAQHSGALSPGRIQSLPGKEFLR
jgi:hypothetical protein